METLLDRRHTTMMLIVVFAATLMDGLDGSIVSIVLPTIAQNLHVDTATSSWATIIYMLVLAGLLVPFARVSAQIGVRKVLAYGLVIFSIGSLLCGIATSFPMLIAFRAIQAVGASMMAAAGPMCCTEHLPPEKLGFGMSVVTIGASVGFALGPVVGGAISQFIDWHWVFLINIPFGAVMTPLILYAVPASAERGGKATLDLKGTAVLFIAICIGVLGVEILSYKGMETVSLVLIGSCFALMAVFVKIENNVSEPLLKTSMFRSPRFTSVFLCLMLVNAAYMGVLYLVPFYGEIVLGKSSLDIGIFLLIAAVVTAFLGMPIAKWSDRKGRRWFCVTAGIVVTVCFTLYAIWAKNMNDAELLLIMLLQGLGWAFVGGPMASRLVENAGDERDMASSLMNEAYYIGGAVGTAAIAMLFTIWSKAEGVDITALTATQFTDGFIPSAIVCAAMAFVVLALSFVLKDE